MISDTHRFVFVHIPRTAGTSVETALAAYARSPIGFVANGNTVLPDKHLGAAALRRSLGPAEWSSRFTFSVVRNPWGRMYSDYHFFRRVGPDLAPLFSQRERALTRLALAHDFDRWLHATADRLDICQSAYLEDEAGALLVDYVARFETIDADFAHICQTIGVEHALPRVNGASQGDYRGAYSPAGIALVERHAQRDIERFGYVFDPGREAGQAMAQRCA